MHQSPCETLDMCSIIQESDAQFSTAPYVISEGHVEVFTVS